MGGTKTCNMPGCEGVATTRGLCDRHYAWRDSKNPRKVAAFEAHAAPARGTGKTPYARCEVDGCEKPGVSPRGLCGRHQHLAAKIDAGLADLEDPDVMAVLAALAEPPACGEAEPTADERNDEPDDSEKERTMTQKTEKTCNIPGCDRKPQGRGLCGTHYGWLKSANDEKRQLAERRATPPRTGKNAKAPSPAAPSPRAPESEAAPPAGTPDDRGDVVVESCCGTVDAAQLARLGVSTIRRPDGILLIGNGGTAGLLVRDGEPTVAITLPPIATPAG